MALTGGCQCGAVRFRAAHLGRASLCHCRMCQKAFGNYFAPLVGVEGLVWTKGAPALFRSSTQARRGFCRDCGTPLTFETDAGIDLAIGAFDTPAAIPPTVQFCTESRVMDLAAMATLPGRPAGEQAADAAFKAEVRSFQHPDHD